LTVVPDQELGKVEINALYVFHVVFTVDDENLPEFPVKSLQSRENLLFDEENVCLALKK